MHDDWPDDGMLMTLMPAVRVRTSESEHVPDPGLHGAKKPLCQLSIGVFTTSQLPPLLNGLMRRFPTLLSHAVSPPFTAAATRL